jgi:hypothetical protein
MKSVVLFLYIVTQPPCASVNYERVSDPFPDAAVCEEYKAHVLKQRGPLSPTQTYQCLSPERAQ